MLWVFFNFVGVIASNAPVGNGGKKWQYQQASYPAPLCTSLGRLQYGAHQYQRGRVNWLAQ